MIDTASSSEKDMPRPFEGVKVLDCTHVLAGPFASYELAVLGADVIKVEDPDQPDQSRESGADRSLNERRMGTGFLTQGSNKRAIGLNLKSEQGREAFRRLVGTWADVLIENYRPGAFDDLGLGYDDMSKLNERLIYASMSAFGHEGPRRNQTAYDQVIQAVSGITASTGTKDSGPTRAGPPVVDYATGAMAAFAVSAALFQRTRTGRGQHIDLSMFDVALMLQAPLVTDYLHSGHRPKRRGGRMRFAEGSMHETGDGLVQLAANNTREHRRFYTAMDVPDEAEKVSLTERAERYDEKFALIAEAMRTRTAAEWETFLQSRHIPAGGVRELPEALADEQLNHRSFLHQHGSVPGLDKPVSVPMAAFRFAEGGGPSIERAPPQVGADTDEILASLGFSDREIAEMRETGAAG